MKIEEEGQLLEFYERYLSAFHDLDAQKMNEFYEAPSIFVTDSETIILSDDATLKGFFQKMMEVKCYYFLKLQNVIKVLGF